MFSLRKYRPRRAEIRKNRPDLGLIWPSLQSPQTLLGLAMLLGFWMIAVAITTLRLEMVHPRPGDYIHEDVLSRVRFESRNIEREVELRQAAGDAAPRVYRRIDSAFADLERNLLHLPDDIANNSASKVLKDIHLDSGSITSLKTVPPADYRQWVSHYIRLLGEARDKGKLVVLAQQERQLDMQMPQRLTAKLLGPVPGQESISIELARVFSPPADQPREENQREKLMDLISPLAEQSFLSPFAANIAGYTVDTLGPTHALDRDLTLDEQNQAARNVSLTPATRLVLEKAVLVPKGAIVSQSHHKLLSNEQSAFNRKLSLRQWLQVQAGMAGVLGIITLAMGAYVVCFQPRIVQNQARAIAIAGLLLSMLLITQLAGIGSGPLLLFGVAPSILVAMILAIVYEQRFAMGMASLHGLMVTMALDQSTGFFMIIWLGTLAVCLLTDEIRTRSKPIEIGGIAAVAMALAAAAVAALAGEPLAIIGRNCLHVAAAGLGVGFVVLGILPFIERTFRITTSMTLLELADVSQPLLRRLAMEAPGTYNHSLQVATIAEAAAEAIAGNSLLCRVGSYYHDIGKIAKSEYFCENQFEGPNRHINLNPNVSMLIILGHVKDGVELAKEYNLPTVLFPAIQQHHGTTLIEYFYHHACNQRKAEDADGPPINDTQYRYPGPKPRSRETAIIMLADAAESACRAMVEPTANRVESLIHELTMKRLLDGQFEETDLTFAELELVEKSLVRSIVSIYHGRLAYPSTAATTNGAASGTTVRFA